MFRRVCAVALALLALGVVASTATAKSGLFVPSAVENGDDTVTLPLHAGTSGGGGVFFIVLDASTGEAADQLGVNRSQKLANAAGTAAVQTVDATIADVVAGRVDFRRPSTSRRCVRSTASPPAASRRRSRSPAPSGTRATAR